MQTAYMQFAFFYCEVWLFIFWQVLQNCLWQKTSRRHPWRQNGKSSSSRTNHLKAKRKRSLHGSCLFHCREKMAKVTNRLAPNRSVQEKEIVTQFRLGCRPILDLQKVFFNVSRCGFLVAALAGNGANWYWSISHSTSTRSSWCCWQCRWWPWSSWCLSLSTRRGRLSRLTLWLEGPIVPQSTGNISRVCTTPHSPYRITSHNFLCMKVQKRSAKYPPFTRHFA